MAQQIFISHSKEERDLLGELDRVFSKAGVRQYIANFEDQSPPVSEDIKAEINRSRAMIVVLGPEAHENDVSKLWIAWEAGIALQRNIPIWIFEDVNSQVEMFIPSFTDYILYDQTLDGQRRILRDIIENELGLARSTPLELRPMSLETQRLPDANRNIGIDENSRLTVHPRNIQCPYDECGEIFNIWFKGPANINCPSCRKPFSIDSDPVIEIEEGEFDPVLVKIDPGDTIKWRNLETRAHTVSDIEGVGCDPWSFEEELLGSSECKYTFDNAGRYGFKCSDHGKFQECGMVLVGDVEFEGTLPCI